MARKQITTVRLERQPHRDAIHRLSLAYEYLAEAAKQASQPAERQEQIDPPSQEVKSCQ